MPLAFAACVAGCLTVFRGRLSAAARSGLILLLVAGAGAGAESVSADATQRRAHTSLARLLDDGRTLCVVAGTVDGEVTRAKLSPLIETPDIELGEVSSFRLRATGIESDGLVRPASGDVRMSVRGELGGIGHGDAVRVLGWISPLDPSDPANRYELSKGFVARLSVATPAAVRLEAENPGSPRRFLYAAKRSFRQQIDAYFEGDTAAVLKATLLGDRERLGRQLGKAFNQSGTMHVLAISGLHVGIVYAVALWLCRRLLIERWPRRAIVLTAVLAYTVMVGFRPATLRAALMILLLETGDWLRYYREPLNAVAAAALVILAAAPGQLFEAGFQLTFVAVFAILLFARDLMQLLWRPPDDLERLVEPEFQSRWKQATRPAHKALAATLAVCAAATLGVTPLQAYYFNIVTPISVIATAALFPLVGAAIWGGFAFLAVASFLPVLAGPVAFVLSLIATMFTEVVRLAASVPLGHVFVAPPAPGWVALFYLALLIVAARRWLRLSGATAVLAPAALLCVYLGWRAFVSPGPDLAATFVDVRHGASVLITKGRQTIVYDCGSGTPFSTYDVGRGPVARELWARGVKRIDVLVLSHTDADHVNGVVSLVERFPVGRIVVNRTFGDDEIGAALIGEFGRRGLSVVEATHGDQIALGDIHIDVLWPPPAGIPWRLYAVNDRSLVARVTGDGRSILLTGDIEQAGMGGVLATSDALGAEVLYVPHHGADEPVLEEFVRAVGPHIAVISGAPWDTSDTATAALHPARVLRTSEHGTITLTARNGVWQIRVAR